MVARRSKRAKGLRACPVVLAMLCLLVGCGTEPTSLAVPVDTPNAVATEVARIRATTTAETATAAAAQTATALAVTQTPTDTATPTATATETPSPTPTFTPTPLPTSQLQGQVLDESSGQPLTGAQVTAGEWLTTTNSNGYFVFSDLPPGQYTVLVTLADHDPVLSGIVKVSAGEQTVVDATLPAEGAGEYPEHPMATNQIDPAGAPTAEDAERLARQQGFTGEVTSIQPVTLTGEYLVNYRRGDTIRSALATLHHPGWELVDEAGQAWYIVRVCGNLAVVRAPQVEVPAQCVTTPHPVVTVGDRPLSAYACPSEGCEVVAEMPAGWHGIALACSKQCEWLLVQVAGIAGDCWVRRDLLEVLGDLDRLPVIADSAGRIAFTCQRQGNAEICAVNPDGSGLANLTKHPAMDGDPVWSPDGERIAFLSQRDGNAEIYVVNADGSGQINVTRDPSADRSPAWSPDSSHIAFASDRSGNGDIYVVGANGSGLARLADRPSPDYEPSWSPDGTHIVFAAYRDVGYRDLYVVNAEGGQLTKLNDDSTFKVFPSWSPDGTQVAFAAEEGGKWWLYIMDASGGRLRRLTDQPTSGAPPRWSPDGKRIAFCSMPPNMQTEIFVINADGSGLANLTKGRATEYWPTWSPDSKRIAFQSFRNNRWGIYVMKADGTDATFLAEGTMPCWSLK